MGISPSVILKQINKIRINLEHFYKIPDRDRVEDAIQIAQLFLDVTTLSLSNFWGSVEIFNEKEEKKSKNYSTFNGITLNYSNEENQFIFENVKDGTMVSKIQISANSGDVYLMLVKLIVTIGKQMHRLDEKIQRDLFERFYLSILHFDKCRVEK